MYNRIGIETYSQNPTNVLVCFAFFALTQKKGPDSRFFGPDNPTVNAMVLTAGPDSQRGPGNQALDAKMS